MNRKNVRFWVRDTGSGIALIDQARIFERFARAVNSYRHSEGTGLGLNIVQAIAEAHGGRVKLTSQRFHFYINFALRTTEREVVA